ncbi:MULTISPECIES: alpha/beta hydrolase [Clostridia]|uniref:Alpha/beta hydrolase n=1 Tax=Clostridium saudiense TaxID=1414720 RepID=A0ABS2FC36_9CLOT|nr:MULTISPECIES: alpha/beta hydrolase [Clostridiaceae]MBM6818105.1 alpha/beta hydrolase [Clostridium saudiense]
MKKKKLLGISLGIIAVIIVISLSLIGNYFYNLALNPTTPKDIVFGTPEEAATTSGQVLDSDISWLLNHSNYTDEYITSSDNLKLHSYQIKNETSSDKWVITVHGYTSEGINMSSYAKKYYDNGYNVLIPDLRAHGLSEGDYIGMGWDDRLDIISWINYILNEEPNAEIILHGVSMGAATVLMTSGEEIPSNVKAIVADCGYTSVWDEFAYQLDDLFSLPEFPILNVSSIVAKIRAGYFLGEASSIDQVKKSKTPILYIHGDQDDFVPYYMMEELYNATSSEKEMLTIKGAEHAKASEVDPETYWTSVNNFINKYIK